MKIMITLNENKTQRKIGYFFLVIYIGIFAFFTFWDGYIFEWLYYGYNGKSQHFDFIFNDMVWDIVGGERIYYSTNNADMLLYMCHWTGLFASFALITGNKYLRQGAMATMAFPVMSAFSTINPIVAIDLFNPDVFLYHTYIQQIVSDIVHITGAIMGVYLFYIAAKQNEELEIKKYTPTLLFTWLLYIVTKFSLQKYPWVEGSELAYHGTNQVNNMPFYIFGFEYLLVLVIIYIFNTIIKYANRKIPNPKYKTLVPFAIFASLTIIFVLTGLVVLQDLPPIEAFIQ